jgi:hypothetical protein
MLLIDVCAKVSNGCGERVALNTVTTLPTLLSVTATPDLNEEFSVVIIDVSGSHVGRVRGEGGRRAAVRESWREREG